MRGECTTALYNRLAREKVAKAEPRRRRRRKEEEKEKELRKNKQNLTQGVRKKTSKINLKTAQDLPKIAHDGFQERP